jgi:hypothetical protein
MERVVSARIRTIGGCAVVALGLTAQASAAQTFECPAGEAIYGLAGGVLGGYNYNALDNGFIAIESRTAHPSGDWLVLEHCPTRQHLMVLGEPDLPAEATNIFWRMVNSDESYTFQQMGDLIVRSGASIGIGQGQSDSCPCAREADPASREGAGW